MNVILFNIVRYLSYTKQADIFTALNQPDAATKARADARAARSLAMNAVRKELDGSNATQANEIFAFIRNQRKADLIAIGGIPDADAAAQALSDIKVEIESISVNGVGRILDIAADFVLGNNVFSKYEQEILAAENHIAQLRQPKAEEKEEIKTAENEALMSVQERGGRPVDTTNLRVPARVRTREQQRIAQRMVNINRLRRMRVVDAIISGIPNVWQPAVRHAITAALSGIVPPAAALDALTDPDVVSILTEIAAHVTDVNDFLQLLPQIINLIVAHPQEAANIALDYFAAVEGINAQPWTTQGEGIAVAAQALSPRLTGYGVVSLAFSPQVERRLEARAQLSGQISDVVALQIAVINDEQLQSELFGQNRQQVIVGRIRALLDQYGFTNRERMLGLTRDEWANDLYTIVEESLQETLKAAEDRFEQRRVFRDKIFTGSQRLLPMELFPLLPAPSTGISQTSILQIISALTSGNIEEAVQRTASNGIDGSGVLFDYNYDHVDPVTAEVTPRAVYRSVPGAARSIVDAYLIAADKAGLRQQDIDNVVNTYLEQLQKYGLSSEKKTEAAPGADDEEPGGGAAPGGGEPAPDGDGDGTTSLVTDLQNPMASFERMQELGADVRTIFEVMGKTTYPILLEVGQPSRTLLLTAGADAVAPPIGLLTRGSDLSRRWALYQLLRAQQRTAALALAEQALRGVQFPVTPLADSLPSELRSTDTDAEAAALAQARMEANQKEQAILKIAIENRIAAISKGRGTKRTPTYGHEEEYVFLVELLGDPTLAINIVVTSDALTVIRNKLTNAYQVFAATSDESKVFTELMGIRSAEVRLAVRNVLRQWVAEGHTIDRSDPEFRDRVVRDVSAAYPIRPASITEDHWQVLLSVYVQDRLLEYIGQHEAWLAFIRPVIDTAIEAQIRLHNYTDLVPIQQQVTQQLRSAPTSPLIDSARTALVTGMIRETADARTFGLVSRITGDSFANIIVRAIAGNPQARAIVERLARGEKVKSNEMNEVITAVLAGIDTITYKGNIRTNTKKWLTSLGTIYGAESRGQTPAVLRGERGDILPSVLSPVTAGSQSIPLFQQVREWLTRNHIVTALEVIGVLSFALIIAQFNTDIRAVLMFRTSQLMGMGAAFIALLYGLQAIGIPVFQRIESVISQLTTRAILGILTIAMLTAQAPMFNSYAKNIQIYLDRYQPAGHVVIVDQGSDDSEILVLPPAGSSSTTVSVSVASLGYDKDVSTALVTYLNTQNTYGKSNAEQKRLVEDVRKLYQSLEATLGKGNVNSINTRLVLAGAQVVEITNEQGVVIARVVTYPSDGDPSGLLKHDDVFPSATTEERGAQTAAVALSDIQSGLPGSKSQGYVVALPQIGLTCYLHTLTAAMSLIDAQTTSTGTVPVVIDPLLYAELLSPEAQSRQSAFLDPKLMDKYLTGKTPEEQAMTLLNLGVQGSGQTEFRTILRNMGYELTDETRPLFSVSKTKYEISNDLLAILLAKYPDIQYETGNNKIIAYLTSAEMREFALRAILEQQEERFAGTSHAMMLGLNSTRTTDHTALFLGFVERDGEVFVRLADGMMTTFVNPVTWGVYPGIEKDSSNGTYLMPVDTFLTKFRGVRVLSVAGAKPPPQPAQVNVDIPPVQSNLSETSNLPSAPVVQSPAAQNTQPRTVLGPAAKTRAAIMSNIFADILNDWQNSPDRDTVLASDALKQGLIDRGFETFARDLDKATYDAYDFLDETYNTWDNQEIQCVVFANLLVESGLIDFNIPISAIGGDVAKSMVGDELSNDPDGLVSMGNYFVLRVQSQEDLATYGPGHLFVVYNKGSKSPGHIAYIDTNEAGVLTFTVYDSNYDVSTGKVVGDGLIRAETLTFDQFVAKYGAIAQGRGRSQIAILLTQDEGIKLTAVRQQGSLPGTNLNLGSVFVGVAYSATQRPFRFVQRIIAGRALKASAIASGNPGQIQRSVRANIAFVRAFWRTLGQQGNMPWFSRTISMIGSAWQALWRLDEVIQVVVPQSVGRFIPVIIGRFFPSLLTPPPTPIQQPTGRSPSSPENNTLRAKQRTLVEATILQSFLSFIDKPNDSVLSSQLHTIFSQNPDVLSEFADYFYDDLHQKSLTSLTREMFPESERLKATPEWLALVNASGDIPQQVWSSASWPLLAKLGKTIAKAYDVKNLFGANHVLLDEATQKLLGDHLLKEIIVAFEKTRATFGDTKGAFGFIRETGDTYAIFMSDDVSVENKEKFLKLFSETLEDHKMFYKEGSGIVYQGIGVHPSEAKLTLEDYARADVVSLTEAVQGKIVYEDNLEKLRQTHPYLEALLQAIETMGDGTEDDVKFRSFLTQLTTTVLVDDVLQEKTEKLDNAFKEKDPKAFLRVFRRVKDFVRAVSPIGKARIFQVSFAGSLKHVVSDFEGERGEKAGDYMIQEQFEPVMNRVFDILKIHKIDVFHKSANDFAILLPAGTKVDEKAFRKALDIALAELKIEDTLYYSHPAFGITDVEFVKTGNEADDLVKNMAIIGAALGRLATAVNVDTLKSIGTQFFVNGSPRQDLKPHRWDWLRRYLSTDEVLEKRGRIRLAELGVTEEEMSALEKVEYKNGKFMSDGEVASAGEWQKMIGGFVERYYVGHTSLWQRAGSAFWNWLPEGMRDRIFDFLWRRQGPSLVQNFSQLAPFAGAEHMISIPDVQSSIFHPMDAIFGIYVLAVGSGESATINGEQLVSGERRELHDLDEIVITKGDQIVRGVIFFFGPLEPLFIQTRIPILDESRAKQFPDAQIEQQWKLITEAIKRRIPANPELQRVMLSFENVPVSEAMPLEMIRAAADADPVIKQLSDRYENILIRYLTLPTIPQDIVGLDLHSVKTLENMSWYREKDKWSLILHEAIKTDPELASVFKPSQSYVIASWFMNPTAYLLPTVDNASVDVERLLVTNETIKRGIELFTSDIWGRLRDSIDYHAQTHTGELMGLDPFERNMIAQRYRFAREVKLLALSAEINPQLSDATSGRKVRLSSGVELTLVNESLSESVDLLNPQVWGDKTLLSSSNDRIYRITVAGRQYLLKEQRSAMHQNRILQGPFMYRNTSQTEFETAQYMREHATGTFGDVLVNWEMPLGFVTFPDGYQFTVFSYEENLQALPASFDGIRRNTSTEIYLRDDTIEKLSNAIISHRDQFGAEYRASIQGLPQEVSFTDFALAKARLIYEDAVLLIEFLPISNGYYVSDLDGFDFRIRTDPRVMLEVVGFDFEAFYRFDSEKMPIGWNYNTQQYLYETRPKKEYLQSYLDNFVAYRNGRISKGPSKALDDAMQRKIYKILVQNDQTQLKIISEIEKMIKEQTPKWSFVDGIEQRVVAAVSAIPAAVGGKNEKLIEGLFPSVRYENLRYVDFWADILRSIYPRTHGIGLALQKLFAALPQPASYGRFDIPNLFGRTGMDRLTAFLLQYHLQLLPIAREDVREEMDIASETLAALRERLRPGEQIAGIVSAPVAPWQTTERVYMVGVSDSSGNPEYVAYWIGEVSADGTMSERFTPPVVHKWNPFAKISAFMKKGLQQSWDGGATFAIGELEAPVLQQLAQLESLEGVQIVDQIAGFAATAIGVPAEQAKDSVVIAIQSFGPRMLEKLESALMMLEKPLRSGLRVPKPIISFVQDFTERFTSLLVKTSVAMPQKTVVFSDDALPEPPVINPNSQRTVTQLQSVMGFGSRAFRWAMQLFQPKGVQTKTMNRIVIGDAGRAAVEDQQSMLRAIYDAATVEKARERADILIRDIQIQDTNESARGRVKEFLDGLTAMGFRGKLTVNLHPTAREQAIAGLVPLIVYRDRYHEVEQQSGEDVLHELNRILSFMGLPQLDRKRIVFTETTGFSNMGAVGYDKATQQISYPQWALSVYPRWYVLQVLFHEYTHALTVPALETITRSGLILESEERMLAEVVALRGQREFVRTNGLQGFYLVNVGVYKRYIDAGQDLYDRALAIALQRNTDSREAYGAVDSAFEILIRTGDITLLAALLGHGEGVDDIRQGITTIRAVIRKYDTIHQKGLITMMEEVAAVQRADPHENGSAQRYEFGLLPIDPFRSNESWLQRAQIDVKVLAGKAWEAVKNWWGDQQKTYFIDPNVRRVSEYFARLIRSGSNRIFAPIVQSFSRHRIGVREVIAGQDATAAAGSIARIFGNYYLYIYPYRLTLRSLRVELQKGGAEEYFESMQSYTDSLPSPREANAAAKKILSLVRLTPVFDGQANYNFWNSYDSDEAHANVLGMLDIINSSVHSNLFQWVFGNGEKNALLKTLFIREFDVTKHAQMVTEHGTIFSRVFDLVNSGVRGYRVGDMVNALLNLPDSEQAYIPQYADELMALFDTFEKESVPPDILARMLNENNSFTGKPLLTEHPEYLSTVLESAPTLGTFIRTVRTWKYPHRLFTNSFNFDSLLSELLLAGAVTPSKAKEMVTLLPQIEPMLKRFVAQKNLTSYRQEALLYIWLSPDPREAIEHIRALSDESIQYILSLQENNYVMKEGKAGYVFLSILLNTDNAKETGSQILTLVDTSLNSGISYLRSAYIESLSHQPDMSMAITNTAPDQVAKLWDIANQLPINLVLYRNMFDLMFASNDASAFVDILAIYPRDQIQFGVEYALRTSGDPAQTLASFLHLISYPTVLDGLSEDTRKEIATWMFSVQTNNETPEETLRVFQDNAQAILPLLSVRYDITRLLNSLFVENSSNSLVGRIRSQGIESIQIATRGNRNLPDYLKKRLEQSLRQEDVIEIVSMLRYYVYYDHGTLRLTDSSSALTDAQVQEKLTQYVASLFPHATTDALAVLTKYTLSDPAHLIELYANRRNISRNPTKFRYQISNMSEYSRDILGLFATWLKPEEIHTLDPYDHRTKVDVAAMNNMIRLFPLSVEELSQFIRFSNDGNEVPEISELYKRIAELISEDVKIGKIHSHQSTLFSYGDRILPYISDEAKSFVGTWVKQNSLRNRLNKPDGYAYFTQHLQGKSLDEMVAQILQDETTAGNILNAWNTLGNLLTTKVLNLLPADQKEFWKTYKIMPQLQWRLKQSDGFIYYKQALVGKTPDEMIATLIQTGTANGNFQTLYGNMSSAITEHVLSLLSDDYARFWRTYNEPQSDAFHALFTDLTLVQSETDSVNWRAMMGGMVIDDTWDRAIGGRMSYFKNGNSSSGELLSAVLRSQITYLQSQETFTLSQTNWHALLNIYLLAQDPEEYNSFGTLTPELATKVKEYFEPADTKDAILKEVESVWQAYLAQDDPLAFPLRLIATGRLLDRLEGGGALTRIYGLTSFATSLYDALRQLTTSDSTKQSLLTVIRQLEGQMVADRWSGDDRQSFYSISADVLHGSPSLANEIFSFMSSLSPDQKREFVRSVYPLYRAQLALIEKPNTKIPYDVRTLVGIRTDIERLKLAVSITSDAFASEKARLTGAIQETFKDRFGIIRLPTEYDNQKIRSIVNVTLYLANLSRKEPKDQAILGLYLAMMLNNTWDEYRAGKPIDPKLYLTAEKAALVDDAVKSRQTINDQLASSLGLEPADMEKFQLLLQKESSAVSVGDVETIDVKLTNIILNLRELSDPDLYTEPLDRQRMELLLQYGNKMVGAVVAKMYQGMTQSDRAISFTPEEEAVRQDILSVLTQNNRAVSAGVLKEVFQDGLRPFSAVTNLLQYVDDVKAQEQVEALRSLLIPSEEIVALFNRFGEQFTPTSGAYAVSQDLDYLENFIVKHDRDLTKEETAMLQEYLQKIRDQLVSLEGMYDKISSKFTSFRTAQAERADEQLQNKLRQIDNIIRSQTTQQVVTSSMTNNLDTIIENMRACLACVKRQGSGQNNDTNLSFGDPNKFYLYTRSENQLGSIADQILFVEPAEYADGETGAVMVFDTVYGTKTPSILFNQIAAVANTYRRIRTEFPNIRLRLLVASSALAGLQSSDQAITHLTKLLGPEYDITSADNVKVNVLAPSIGDHYIEFGGDARRAGLRNVGGILISAKSVHKAKESGLFAIEQVAQNLIDDQTQNCDGQAGMPLFTVYAADPSASSGQGKSGCSVIGWILEKTGMTGKMPNRTMWEKIWNAIRFGGPSERGSLKIPISTRLPSNLAVFRLTNDGLIIQGSGNLTVGKSIFSLRLEGAVPVFSKLSKVSQQSGYLTRITVHDATNIRIGYIDIQFSLGDTSVESIASQMGADVAKSIFVIAEVGVKEALREIGIGTALKEYTDTLSSQLLTQMRTYPKQYPSDIRMFRFIVDGNSTDGFTSKFAESHGYKTIEPGMKYIREIQPVSQSYIFRLQAVIEKAEDDGCFSYNPFVKRVYAAGEKSGATCLWFFQKPITTIGENADMLFDDEARREKIKLVGNTVRDIAGKTLVIEIKFVKKFVKLEELTRSIYWLFGRFGGNSRLSKPDPYGLGLTGAGCWFNNCQQGCVSGLQCREETGCCEGKGGYKDTRCSSNGNAEIYRSIDRDGDLFQPDDVKLCDDRGCVNGKCLGYKIDTKGLPKCSSLPNNYTMSDISEWSYLPVTSCVNDDGTIGSRTGVPAEEYKKYTCSKDGNKLLDLDGKVVNICGSGLACAKAWNSADCFLISSIQALELCSPTVRFDSGYFCTDEGLRCRPGERLPISSKSQCERTCLSDGIATEIAFPVTCTPNADDYQDITCKTDPKTGKIHTAIVNSVKDVEILVGDACSNGCIRGRCIQKEGDVCRGDGKYEINKEGTCPVVCRDGKWQKSNACDNVKVYGYNNLGPTIIYETLDKLPKFMFDGMDLTMRNDYAGLTDIGHNDAGGQDVFAGSAFTRNISLISDITENGTDMIIHEFFHNWAYQNANYILPVIGQSKFITTASDLLWRRSLDTGPAPESYIQLTHCDNPKQRLPTVRDYAATNCGEDFAEHATWYVNHACELLKGGESENPEAGKIRYDYFKNQIFRGKEYLPAGGCGN